MFLTVQQYRLKNASCLHNKGVYYLSTCLISRMFMYIITQDVLVHVYSFFRHGNKPKFYETYVVMNKCYLKSR